MSAISKNFFFFGDFIYLLPKVSELAPASPSSCQLIGKKVKHSHYRPGQVQRVPWGWGSQISWQRNSLVVGCQPYAPAALFEDPHASPSCPSDTSSMNMKLIVQDWWKDNGVGTRRLEANLSALYYIKFLFTPYIATGSTIHCVVCRVCLYTTLKIFNNKHIVEQVTQFTHILGRFWNLQLCFRLELGPPNRNLAKYILVVPGMSHTRFSQLQRSLFFTLCWPYISVHPCKENQRDALLILRLFRQSISTCFGHICSPSSGGKLYVYSDTSANEWPC